MPDQFFGPRVTNVTGILGGNGAGKSTLLEFIQRLVGSFRDDGWLTFEAHHEAIVILDEYVLYHESLPIDRRRSTLAGFTVLSYRKSLRDNVRRPAVSGGPYQRFYEFAVIAYANHYETSVDNENSNVIDVSTSHLLNSTIWRQQVVGRSGPAAILEFESREFQAEINLLRYLAGSGLASEIPFALPPTIGLQVLELEEALPRREGDAEQRAADRVRATAGWQRQLEEDFRPDQQALPFEEFVQRLISLHLLTLLRRCPQELESLTPAARLALRTLRLQGIDLPGEVVAGLRGLERFVDYLRQAYQAGQLQVLIRRTNPPRYDSVAGCPGRGANPDGAGHGIKSPERADRHPHDAPALVGAEYRAGGLPAAVRPLLRGANAPAQPQRPALLPGEPGAGPG